MFFFEKKNQKTFIPCRCAATAPHPRERRESLFASFSSEKEVLMFFLQCLARGVRRVPLAAAAAGR